VLVCVAPQNAVLICSAELFSPKVEKNISTSVPLVMHPEQWGGGESQRHNILFAFDGRLDPDPFSEFGSGLKRAKMKEKTQPKDR
jgi:hypothetical protein